MLKKWTILLTVIGLMAFSGLALAVEGEEEPESDNDTVLTYTYDEATHFLVWNITSIEFPDACGEEPTEGEEEAAEGEEEAAEGECVSGEGEVGGPNGQINHGQFMKLFNSLYEGKHRGCLVRLLAQSDLGKGDQQVKVSDIEEIGEGGEEDAVEPVEGEEPEEVSIETTCERGKGKGGPDKERPDKGPKNENRGKSGDAPGRNKP